MSYRKSIVFVTFISLKYVLRNNGTFKFDSNDLHELISYTGPLYMLDEIGNNVLPN